MNQAEQLAPTPIHYARLRVVGSEGKGKTNAAGARRPHAWATQLPALSRPNRGLYVVDRGQGSQELARAFASVGNIRTLPGRNVYLDHGTLLQAKRIVAQIEREVAQRVERERTGRRRETPRKQPQGTVPFPAQKSSVTNVLRRFSAALGL